MIRLYPESNVSLCRPLIVLIALSLPAAAWAQPPRPAAPPAAGKGAVYAINAAGIGSAMSWCMAKYGAMTTGSQAEACFFRARNVLVGMQVPQLAASVERQCSDTVTFNTCLTPHVGEFVYKLVDEFRRQGL